GLRDADRQIQATKDRAMAAKSQLVMGNVMDRSDVRPGAATDQVDRHQERAHVLGMVFITAGEHPVEVSSTINTTRWPVTSASSFALVMMRSASTKPVRRSTLSSMTATGISSALCFLHPSS